MKVILAGFNCDRDFFGGNKGQPTPETLAAAYARISRSEKPVDELRAEAFGEVDAARKSNQTIIFEMGHASIAEHAVFNFDIIGISRYLTEFIQRTRLASFTEKSQRYVKMNRDYVVPPEIAGTPLESPFIAYMDACFRHYQDTMDIGMAAIPGKPGSRIHREMSVSVKEDARYFLPMATNTQMGMTINARSLERLLRRLDACGLAEAALLRETLITEVSTVTPSLIRYTRADWTDQAAFLPIENTISGVETEQPVVLEVTPDAEAVIVALGLFEELGLPYQTVLEAVKQMPATEIGRHYRSLFEGMNCWNGMPRAFEGVSVTLGFTMSHSCFAQMKRHRLVSLYHGKPGANSGFVVPALFSDCGMESRLDAVLAESAAMFNLLENHAAGLGKYSLLNGHRLHVVARANLREWYHISRLRSDKHAQWEIRRISQAVDDVLKSLFPHAGTMLGGKDRFSES